MSLLKPPQTRQRQPQQQRPLQPQQLLRRQNQQLRHQLETPLVVIGKNELKNKVG